MGTIKRTGPVVVEVDGSAESLRVIVYGCQEASRYGADLLLVRPYQPHAPYSSMTQFRSDSDAAEQAQADLREAVQQVRSQSGFDVVVSTAAVDGSRQHVLARAAERARLLVVGRRRAHGPRRTVSAQIDLNLAGTVDCPVVVVPAGWRRSVADRTIYVGVDGSALSQEAIAFAYETAARRRGTLVVVHADTGARRDGITSWSAPLELTVAESLAGFAEEYPEVQVTRYVTNQQITDALVGASQHAGLLVLGAHAGRLPHDPTTRRALADAACPVAVVKHEPTPDDRRSPRETGTGIVVPTY